jgi:hypothetical protein
VRHSTRLYANRNRSGIPRILFTWLSSPNSPHHSPLQDSFKFSTLGKRLYSTSSSSYKKLSVKATQVDTGKTTLFSNKAEAARSLGLTKKAVECRCKNGKPFEINGISLVLSYVDNFPTTLTPEQREVIIGCSLGDLHIHKHSTWNAHLQFSQSTDHSKYLMHLYSLFNSFCRSEPRVQ